MRVGLRSLLINESLYQERTCLHALFLCPIRGVVSTPWNIVYLVSASGLIQCCDGRQLVLANPGHHLPAVYDTYVRSPVVTTWTNGVGLVLADSGRTPGRFKLYECGLR